MSRIPDDHDEAASGESYTLLRYARDDHAPSVADRQRVRRALAQHFRDLPERDDNKLQLKAAK